MTAGRSTVTTWRTVLEQVFKASLVEKTPRDHQQSNAEFRRRRVVVAVVLVIGAVLLGISLAASPGSFAFYPLTLAVAATWVVGGFLSGPLHLGYMPWHGSLRRPLITPIVTGLLAGALFVAGALIVRQIPPLRDYVATVLEHARQGSAVPIAAVTLINGLAEEVFFRGGLFAAIGRRNPVVISTVVYAIATIATGNPMLVFAALVLGLVLGLQRRASGGILAPMLTHVTWSVIMLFALPPLFS